MRDSRLTEALIIATALHVHAQQPPAAGEILLHPEQIKVTGTFEMPARPAAVERAINSVDEQIDAKRAAEAARIRISPIWELAIWRYLPSDPANTLNSPVASDDNAFLTPEYLKIAARQLDLHVKKSDQASDRLLH